MLSKKVSVWFLVRFLVISLVYFFEFVFIYRDFFLLDVLLNPAVFPFMLVLYLTAIVASFLFDEKTTSLIKLFSDIFFILLFIFQTIVLLHLGLNDIGDSGIALAGIMLYVPMFLCFIVWFIRDLMAVRIQHFYFSFFLRLIIVSVLYYGINYFNSFILLLDKDVFIFVLLLYLLITILSSWLEKSVVLKLKIISDLSFLGLFLIQVFCHVYYLYKEFSKLEPKIENMLWYSPLVVLFGFWLVLDLRNYNKEQFRRIK